MYGQSHSLNNFLICTIFSFSLSLSSIASCCRILVCLFVFCFVSSWLQTYIVHTFHTLFYFSLVFHFISFQACGLHLNRLNACKLVYVLCAHTERCEYKHKRAYERCTDVSVRVFVYLRVSICGVCIYLTNNSVNISSVAAF